ncbi:MFS transporter [Thermosediminibacter oceani]|uniref:Major facilitator superfamily MFS_1 n=1 Tax=Thermosediminibacter oceani (strain ATCC BAA-1034 / DSM 16646 / JW/IW-1228P) TaxID=555079 RepID=D9S0L0_THEOJ|nr:MFS transporter [Thermosediminibacter oceani]ADL08868.1 major facilitator superfamily MFS_1 [Thermosediminibacter oceani DSM 16646]
MHLFRFSLDDRNLFLISIGVFIAQIAFSSITPFLPSLLIELGLKSNISFWSSLIFSVQSVVFGIMAPVWGAISDRYGKKPMMARAGLGMGVVYFLLAASKNHIQLLLLRALNGALSGYIPASISLVASTSRPDRLNQNLGMVNTASAVGAITGPMIGGLTAKVFGMRGSLAFSGFLLIIAGSLPYVTRIKEPPRSQKAEGSIKDSIIETFKNRQLTLVFMTGLFTQAALMAILPTLNLVMRNIAPQNAEFYTGLVFSIIGVSTAIASPFIGRMTDIPLTSLYRWSLIGSSILTALQGLAASVTSLLILRFIFGFFNAAMTISGNVLIAKAGGSGSQGSSFGVYNGIMSIGLVFGSILGGIMGDRFGLAFSFFASTALFLAAYLISFLIKEPTEEEPGV